IAQIVAAPRRPQTLGKIERFWGTLWRECLERALFIDLGDAQRRIGHFIDHYNFQRPHQGIDGLVPADRFFGAASEVRRTLQARVSANALELARQGLPKQPFYLTGQVGGQSFSVHAEGERVILTPASGARQEIDLVPPAPAKARGPGGQSLSQGHSREARRLAAAILEVLAGARTPTQAAQALGLSLVRYYQVESRAMHGLVAACEARPKGKVRSVDSELA